jgi:cytochrome c biogenesis protein CcmG/thiol:disulfide interchange protein DsbE
MKVEGGSLKKVNKKNFFYLIPLLLFLILIYLFYGSLQKDNNNSIQNNSSVFTGKAFPKIEYKDEEIDGTIYSGFGNISFQRNEISVVNIWASWCTPCRAEHEFLMELSDLSIPIYGINYRDKYENANNFLKELGNPYTGIGFDSDGVSAVTLGIFGVPETIIVGRDGNIIKKYLGPITPIQAEEIKSMWMGVS